MFVSGLFSRAIEEYSVFVLPEPVGQCLSNDAPHHVDGAAGGKRNDDGDRFIRIILRRSGNGECKDGSRERELEELHQAISRIFLLREISKWRAHPKPSRAHRSRSRFVITGLRSAGFR